MTSSSHNSDRISYSVCIPAYNEERTISRTIRSVLVQSFRTGCETDAEVIVCANNCSDDTAAKVRYLEEEYPGVVKLIEVDEAGKPNASNILLNAARHDLIYFVDADVEIDSNAFRHIYETFVERPHLTLVAGTNAATFENSSPLTRWTVDHTKLTAIETPEKDTVYVKPYQDYICGRLYAVRRSKLLSAFAFFDYAEMPKHIIHDDSWLQQLLDTAASKQQKVPIDDVILGRNRYWAVCRQAYVYFAPYDWKEEAKLEARALLGHEQLSRLFPEYSAARDRIRAKKREESRNRAVKLASSLVCLSWSAQIKFILRKFLWRHVRSAARRIADEKRNGNAGSHEWIRSEASKIA